MKTLKLIAVLIAILVPVFAQAQEYLSSEIYPQGPLFIAAGFSQDNDLKVDTWTNVGSEIGTTVGANFSSPLDHIDYLKLGFGPSIMTVCNETWIAAEERLLSNETQDIGYLNFDIGFGLTVGSTKINSYTMWQNSQHDSIDDFWFSRNTVAFGDSPIGIFGHMKKAGDNPLEPFWGAYYNLGSFGPVASSQLVLTFNLAPQDKSDGSAADKIWTAWILNF